MNKIKVHSEVLSPASASWRETVLAWEMRCPECGDVGVDRAPSGEDGGDHSAVTVYEDRDEREAGNPLMTRGGFTVTELSCPAGHRFALVSANHKGTELLGLVMREAAGRDGE